MDVSHKAEKPKTFDTQTFRVVFMKHATHQVTNPGLRQTTRGKDACSVIRQLPIGKESERLSVACLFV